MAILPLTLPSLRRINTDTIALLAMAALFNLAATSSFGFPLTAPLSPFRLRAMRDIATRVGFRRMQKGHFTVEEYHE